MKLICRIGWHEWVRWSKPEKLKISANHLNLHDVSLAQTRTCKACLKVQRREL